MSPVEIQGLQVGDLVRFGKSIRKVRKISPYMVTRSKQCGLRVGYIWFAILRRSWTNRPYTIYDHHALRSGHIRLVKRGVRLRTTKNERLVQKEIEAPGEWGPRFITASKMVGTVQ